MSAPAEPRRVAVALCDCVDGAGAVELRESLVRALPDIVVEVVPDLCSHPERGPALASAVGAGRLVVAVGDDGPSRQELQRQARRTGLDPFAVEVVRTRGGVPTELALAAASARQRAFAGSTPEQLRPRLLAADAPVSRRALLTLPPVTYDAVAGVERERCTGASRCSLCVRSCPVGALRTEHGDVVVDRSSCTGCGICVSSCPAGAVGLPGSSLPQYEAQLDVLLGSEKPAICFRCSHAAAIEEAPWLDVEVPSLGMVTPGWVLQALAGGATAVALAGCGSCTSAAAGVADYVGELVELAGGGPAAERVRLVAAGDGLAPPPPAPLAAASGEVCLREPAATAKAVVRLGPRAPLAHPASPLGLVQLRADTCTACGACAGVCPTGALRLENGADEIVLVHDPAACVGCARCERVCPEAAAATLRVEQVTDAAALARGRTPVKVEPVGRCRECGGPIAPQAMLGRIRSLLADDEQVEPLFRILGGLCTACRGAALDGAPRVLTPTAGSAAKGEQ